MSLYFLNDVLGLYLPFEPAKCVFKRFTFLKSNFSQRDCTPLPVLAGLVQLCQASPSQVKGKCAGIYLAFKNSIASKLALDAGRMRWLLS